MRKVLVFGTFDGLHDGHRDMFRQAREYGDCLVVVVARDETVREVKHHSPKHKETERLLAVESEVLVDEALLGNPGDKYQVIMEIKPDVICLGYDQVAFIDKLESTLNRMGLAVPIVRLKPYKPETHKSSLLK